MATEFFLQRVVPTVSATPDYADGDSIGGLANFTAMTTGRSGVITRIGIQTAVTLVGNVIVHLFNGNPSASTFTDNAAVSIHANDAAKRFASILCLVASEQLDAGAGLLEYNKYVTQPFPQSSSGIYLALEAAGAANLGSATDISLWIGGEIGA